MKQFSDSAAAALSTRHLDRARLLVEIAAQSDRPTLRFGPRAENYQGERYEGILLDAGPLRSRLDPFSLRMQPGGLVITVANNRPFMRWNRFSDLLADHALIYADVTVYWVAGNGSASFVLFRGKIERALSATEETCKLDAAESAQALEDKLPLNRVDKTEYPGADPDHVGKIAPHVYGRVKRLTCLAVDAGTISTLVDDINDSVTTIEVTDSSAFPSSGTVQIDAEKITYTGNAINQLPGCGRGASGTAALAHNKGAKVAEVQSSYIYLVADHRVKAIDAVYVDDVRQPLDPAKIETYTGQPGEELAGYEGKAVVAFNARPYIQKQINVTHTDTDNIDFTPGETNITIIPNGWGGNLVNNPTNAYDEKDQTFATINMPGGWFRLDFPSTSYGSISEQKVKVKLGAAANPWTIGGGWSPNSLQINTTGWYTFTKTGGNWDDDVTFIPPAGAGAYSLYEVEKIVQYEQSMTKSGGGTGTLTGNTVAETVVGRAVAADVEGYKDTTGDYGGSGTLIERPDHIRKHMLIELFGLTSAEIDQDSFDDAGAQFAANSYTLAVVLDRVWTFTELAAAMAVQTRTAIFWSQGAERMKWLDESPSPDGGIPHESIVEYEIRHGARARIRNALNALYGRRWDRSGDESYQDSVKAQDADSQNLYGAVAQTFYWDWITESAMAQDVVDFWLEFLKHERLFISGEVFWPALKYDPGDVVTFSDLPLFDNRSPSPRFLITRLGYAADRDTVEIEGVEV